MASAIHSLEAFEYLHNESGIRANAVANVSLFSPDLCTFPFSALLHDLKQITNLKMWISTTAICQVNLKVSIHGPAFETARLWDKLEVIICEAEVMSS